MRNSGVLLILLWIFFGCEKVSEIKVKLRTNTSPIDLAIIDPATASRVIDLADPPHVRDLRFAAETNDPDGDSVFYTWRIYGKDASGAWEGSPRVNTAEAQGSRGDYQSWEYINFVGYPLGDYLLVVTGLDPSGNAATTTPDGYFRATRELTLSSPVHISYDVSKPPLGIDFVSTGSTLTSGSIDLAETNPRNKERDFEIRVIAQDSSSTNGLRYSWALFKENEPGWDGFSKGFVSSENNHQYIFFSDSYTFGRYQLQASVVNDAGLTAQSSLPITVNHSPAKPSIASDITDIYQGSSDSQTLLFRAESTDLDQVNGDILRYTWDVYAKIGSFWDSSPKESFSESSDSEGIDFSSYAVGQYKVEVKAKDSMGAESVASDFIEVDIHPNRAPQDLRIISPAVANQDIYLGSFADTNLRFEASASDLDTGAILHYHWKVFEKIGSTWSTHAIDSSTSIDRDIGFLFSASLYYPGSYKVQISVEDSHGASAVAALDPGTFTEAIVEIHDNYAPTDLNIDQPASSIVHINLAEATLSEPQPNLLNFAASALDVDGVDTLTYEWEIFQELGGVWSSIPAASGTGANWELDFTHYATGRYNLQVSASDIEGIPATAKTGGKTELVITVNNPPKDLEVSLPTSNTIAVYLDSVLGRKPKFRANASDPDGTTPNYSWKIFGKTSSGAWDTTPMSSKTGNDLRINFTGYAAGEYKVQALAEDAHFPGVFAAPKYNGSDIVIVTASHPPNDDGQISSPAATTIEIYTNDTKTLNFTATATDPDPAAVLTYIWQVEELPVGHGPANIVGSYNSSTSIEIDFGDTSIFQLGKSYKVQLVTVKDQYGFENSVDASQYKTVELKTTNR